MVKDLNENLTKKYIQMANKHIKRMSTKDTYDKELLPKINKEWLEVNNYKTNNSVKKWSKTSMKILSKKYTDGK